MGDAPDPASSLPCTSMWKFACRPSAATNPAQTMGSGCMTMTLRGREEPGFMCFSSVFEGHGDCGTTTFATSRRGDQTAGGDARLLHVGIPRYLRISNGVPP